MLWTNQLVGVVSTTALSADGNQFTAVYGGAADAMRTRVARAGAPMLPRGVRIVRSQVDMHRVYTFEKAGGRTRREGWE